MVRDGDCQRLAKTWKWHLIPPWEWKQPRPHASITTRGTLLLHPETGRRLLSSRPPERLTSEEQSEQRVWRSHLYRFTCTESDGLFQWLFKGIRNFISRINQIASLKDANSKNRRQNRWRMNNCEINIWEQGIKETQTLIKTSLIDEPNCCPHQGGTNNSWVWDAPI